MKSYEQNFVAAIHARSCRGVCFNLDFFHFIAIPQNSIVLISLNRCGVVGVGLGAMRNEKIKSGFKKNSLAFQISIELAVFLGIRTKPPWIHGKFQVRAYLLSS
jgi:hypothetical protein